MIKMQIIEKEGVGLYKDLIDAMRTGKLQTFIISRDRKKVKHTNVTCPGWMKWSNMGGVMVCEIVSPRKLGEEWKLLSAFIGRLADKYPNEIHNISIQFPEPSNSGKKTKPKKK